MDDEGRAMADDLADRPEDWERSLHSLSSLIHELMSQVDGESPLRARDPQTASLARELMSAFRDEYQAFLARYGDVARVRPEMPLHVTLSPPQEQAQWLAAMDANLAKQPTWGPLIAGFFADDVERFTRWAADLQ